MPKVSFKALGKPSFRQFKKVSKKIIVHNYRYFKVSSNFINKEFIAINSDDIIQFRTPGKTHRLATCNNFKGVCAHAHTHLSLIHI